MLILWSFILCCSSLFRFVRCRATIQQFYQSFERQKRDVHCSCSNNNNKKCAVYKLNLKSDDKCFFFLVCGANITSLIHDEQVSIGIHTHSHVWNVYAGVKRVSGSISTNHFHQRSPSSFHLYYLLMEAMNGNTTYTIRAIVATIPTTIATTTANRIQFSGRQ